MFELQTQNQGTFPPVWPCDPPFPFDLIRPGTPPSAFGWGPLTINADTQTQAARDARAFQKLLAIAPDSGLPALSPPQDAHQRADNLYRQEIGTPHDIERSFATTNHLAKDVTSITLAHHAAVVALEDAQVRICQVKV